MRRPTIYEALLAKLGRNPTDAEIKADVERIFAEGRAERAAKGRHPRRSTKKEV